MDHGWAVGGRVVVAALSDFGVVAEPAPAAACSGTGCQHIARMCIPAELSYPRPFLGVESCGHQLHQPLLALEVLAAQSPMISADMGSSAAGGELPRLRGELGAILARRTCRPEDRYSGH